MGKILIAAPIAKRHIDCIKSVIKDQFELEFLTDNSKEEYRKQLLDAEMVLGEPPIEYLQDRSNNCPNLKFIQMTWAGTDIYTRSKLPFPSKEVKLANASGAYGQIISQYVIGYIFSLMLNFKTYHKNQEEKIWQRVGPIKSLDKAKVLIYGAGDIGSSIAKRLMGFDAYTIGVCRNTSKKRECFNELCTLEDSIKYISEADIVIGCIPNSDETCNFFDRDKLSLMKPGSIIVNVGRGNFIDCMELNRLLDEGILWGAALDVTNPEPLPKDHPLWNNPRAIITPHVSGVAFSHLDATEDIIVDIFVSNLKAYISGEDLTNLIEF